jgi:replicative DNA helicase
MTQNTLQNPEYEGCLLGCILLDNRVLDEYKIGPSLFANSIYQEVYHAIERARARGAQADIREATIELPDHSATISGLTSMPSPSNVAFYYRQLQELARKRGVVTMARLLTERAYDGSPAEDLFDYADKALAEIADIRETGYQPVSVGMVDTLAEIKRAIETRGALTGIHTGFSVLDEKNNGWQPQSLVVIGARPGAGKTSIALNMSSAALRHDKTVGFFSAEMSAAAIIKRMIADWGDVTFKQLNNGLIGKQAMDKLFAAAQDLAASRLFINDRPAISLRDLTHDARLMRRREKVDILFIDYLSLVSNDRRDIPRHEQVAEISKALKCLARELNIPVIVLSQLTREAQGERPKLSQLRDSGAVEQDADMVILLHNMGYTDDTRTEVKINLIVEKNRNGATGDIPMCFRPLYMRFGQVENAWDEEKRERKA